MYRESLLHWLLAMVLEMLALTLLLLQTCKYSTSPHSSCSFNHCLLPHCCRMAVGASDSDDDIAYFSDTGKCVEIIAPVSSGRTHEYKIHCCTGCGC